MRVFFCLAMSMYLAPLAQADIIKSGPDHFTLKHEGISELSPEDLWARLINPNQWWHPDHSYSGSSEHFSLDLKAGGLWLEEWDGGSVAHGQVLYVNPGKEIRLDAPFGPLQQMAVKAIWTISITPHEDGSKVVFDEVVNGSSESNLEEMAAAVNYVKTEAMSRLISGADYSAEPEANNSD